MTTQAAALKQEENYQKKSEKERVSDALSSIRDVINTNLAGSVDHFANSNAVENSEVIEFPADDLVDNNEDVLILTNFADEGEFKNHNRNFGYKLHKKTGMADMNETTKNTAAEAKVDETKTEPAAEITADSKVTESPATTDSTKDDITLELTEALTEELTEDLMSADTMKKSASAFIELTELANKVSAAAPVTRTGHTVTSENTGQHTVDELMRELLRPMLREWLDAHLPSLVKWLVTEQIEKMLKDQGIAVASSVESLGDTAADITAPAPAAEETDAANSKDAPAKEDVKDAFDALEVAEETA